MGSARLMDKLIAGLHILPCGSKSFWDETGWRCLECLAIYGSMGCPCTGKEAIADLIEDKR